MSEYISSPELCTVCPNRPRLSRMLGTLAGKDIVVLDCGRQLVGTDRSIEDDCTKENAKPSYHIDDEENES
jgi:hypothetical protein